MTTTADIQHAVEELASTLGAPVLIEDARFQPLWWSAQGAVDGLRVASIMQRSVHPAAVAVVKRLKISTAMQPVRTPEIPEAEMLARWCLPLRAEPTAEAERGAAERLLGFLWILDPRGDLGADDLVSATHCAALAAGHLAHGADRHDSGARQRTELLRRLRLGNDSEAALALMELEGLRADTLVVVHSPARPGGWTMASDLSVHVAQSPHPTATSGAPVPLIDLGLAIQRVQLTTQALRAGARISPPTWANLGAWQLIVSAPSTLTATDIHAGAEQLSALARPELLDTARTVLELGNDVIAAAAALHIHRTTLYYRLDRIAQVTGVDLRSSSDRSDLLMALRLAAFRSAEVS